MATGELLIESLRHAAAVLLGEAVSARSEEPAPELIHELRIKTKKVRSYWIAVRPVIGKEGARAAVDRHRSAAKLFSASRDAHVLSQTIASVRESARRRERRALDRVAADLHDIFWPEDTDRSGARMAEFATFMEEDLMAWASVLARADASSDELILTEGVGRTYRKARSFFRDAVVLNTPAGFHRARRWVKYLRYQLEWLVPEGFSDFDPLRQEVATLGRLLGRLHDLHVLQDRISHHSTHIAKPGDLEPVDRLLSREERRLARDAIRHGKKALKASPRRILRKLRRASRPVEGVESLEEQMMVDHEPDFHFGRERTGP